MTAEQPEEGGFMWDLHITGGWRRGADDEERGVDGDDWYAVPCRNGEAAVVEKETHGLMHL